jgi:hypothetical protein
MPAKMFDELALEKTGWNFECADRSARRIVAQLKASAKAKDRAALKIFKTTTGRRRIFLFAPQGSSEKYLVKFYLPANLAKRVKYLVRNSRCRQEYFAAKKLAELKIPSVPAIAFGFRGDYRIPAEEMVIEPFLEGILSFEQLWKSYSAPDRKKLFIAFAKALAVMHEKGVLQRDFKPDSLLAREKGHDFELVLSDLERIRFYNRPLSQAQRTENLGKIFQSFFLCRHAPELDTLLETYSKETGLDFAAGADRELALLRGVRELKKIADKMQNWADKTNELIEKFDHQGMEARVSRSIGKAALQLLLLGKLSTTAEFEVSGKKIELIKTGAAKKMMERYFYLFELGVPARCVLLALDYPDERPGIAGIEIDDEMKTLAACMSAPNKDQSAEFFTGLAKFLFRLDLLGISFKARAGDCILVKKTESAYEFFLNRPDLLAYDPPARVSVPFFEKSETVQKFLAEQNLSAAQVEQMKKAFEAAREKLFK